MNQTKRNKLAEIDCSPCSSNVNTAKIEETKKNVVLAEDEVEERKNQISCSQLEKLGEDEKDSLSFLLLTLTFKFPTDSSSKVHEMLKQTWLRDAIQKIDSSRQPQVDLEEMMQNQDFALFVESTLQEIGVREKQ